MQPHSLSPAPGMNMSPGSGSGIRGGLPEEKNVAQLVKENTNVYARKFQALLDRSTPHVMERWLTTGGLFLLFALSVILRQGVRVVVFGGIARLKESSGTSCAMLWQYTFLTSSWRSYNPASTPHWPPTSQRTTWRKAHPVYLDLNRSHLEVG
jgi:hypothetical protein